MRTIRGDKGVSRIYNDGDLPVGGRCHPSGVRYATIAEVEAAVQQHAMARGRGAFAKASPASIVGAQPAAEHSSPQRRPTRRQPRRGAHASLK